MRVTDQQLAAIANGGARLIGADMAQAIAFELLEKRSLVESLEFEKEAALQAINDHGMAHSWAGRQVAYALGSDGP